jgi:membrane-bound serine protease (ClpP class)
MESALFMVLIGAGILLLFAELMLPTHGVLFALGLAGIAIGVVFAFVAGTLTGLITLAILFVILPAGFYLVGQYWAYLPVGKRLILQRPGGEGGEAAPVYDLALDKLRGRIGKTLSALRPAGVVDFDGRRVDTVTEGMMVDPGQYVRCIDVQSGRVIVRPIDKPDLGELESGIFR